jgi:hypothetical protein
MDWKPGPSKFIDCSWLVLLQKYQLAEKSAE